MGEIRYMNMREQTKQEAAEFIKQAIGDVKQNISLRKPYQMMDRIKNPEDIEATIAETFTAFDAVKKQKSQYDDRRIWSLFGFALVITGLITIKSFIASGIFLVGAIVIALIFSKAHKAAFPLEIEIKAYEGVLLKLHEMKILHEKIITVTKD